MEFGILNRYFPDLTATQLTQLEQLGPLYRDWNEKINVISRKDIDNLYEHHVLHSLAIAKMINFVPGTKVLDAGTGGGFPGIPLAILFPEVDFHLADSTAKKLVVVASIASEIGLANISTEHVRLEEHFSRYDFVVSRAVASFDDMIRWTWKNLKKESVNEIANGILYLKGGDFMEELGGMEAWGQGSGEAGKRGGREAGKQGGIEAGGHGGMEAGNSGTMEQWNNGTMEQWNPGKQPKHYQIYNLSALFREPFFGTKSLVHLF